MRSEDDQDELLETGEIEVVQTELRAAIEGARPAIRQVRPASDQPYGARRASVRKIGTTPGTGPASSASPASVSGASPSSIGPRHHSSLGASVSLGAINQALGAMSTEPAFADREERPVGRAIVRTPKPAPSPLSTRAPSTRLPSPTAAMQQPPMSKALPNLAPPANPHAARRDEEETMARPISSPPPPVSMPASRARMAPPAGGISVPTPFDELEEKTNAVMPIGEMPAETTEEMPIAQPAGAGGAGLHLQTPPTIMGGGAAMPAAFRAHVLQQMQAAREGQQQTAMDALIAQQLANVQRAQPIADPAAAAAPAAAPATDVAGLAQPIAPLPGAIRPPGMPLSSSNVDVPAMAVTARTKVRFRNPALSWTAGLLVVGACVGAAAFVMWKRDSQAEAAAQAARSVQTVAAAQQAQMASTGTYLGQQAAAPQAPAAVQPAPGAPYGGLPANGATGAVANAPTPSPSTTAAAAALTAAALNDGTTGMGGTMAPGNGTQPVMQLTPAQLAVMTGGAPPATPAAAPTPAPATPVAAAAAPVSAASSDDGASHHHHSHATVAASDSPAPTPRAAAPAPAPRATPAPAPKPAPAPVAKKAAPAGNDDMDSAAKALAKAQLEQSL